MFPGVGRELEVVKERGVWGVPCVSLQGYIYAELLKWAASIGSWATSTAIVSVNSESNLESRYAIPSLP